MQDFTRISFLKDLIFIFFRFDSEYVGLYEKSDNVNGKLSWTSTNKVTAIWYNKPSSDWVFGTVEI